MVLIVVLGCLGLGLGTAGCGDTSSAKAAAGTGPVASAPVTRSSLRIVSLSPAISRTLVDLGLGDAVVGRTPFCAAIDPAVPVVGSLLEIDYEKLLATKPTHLLVQPPAATGLDPELARIAARDGIRLETFRFDGIDDVVALLERLPSILPLTTGELAQRDASVAALVEIRNAPVSQVAPRVLLLVGTTPITAAGAGTFLADVLRAAGGRDAIETKGYPELSLEDVTRIDPDVILVLRERMPEAEEANRLLASLRATSTTAARNGKVMMLAEPDAMLPSSRLRIVVEHLRQALSPMRAKDGA